MKTRRLMARCLNDVTFEIERPDHRSWSFHFCRGDALYRFDEVTEPDEITYILLDAPLPFSITKDMFDGYFEVINHG